MNQHVDCSEIEVYFGKTKGQRMEGTKRYKAMDIIRIAIWREMCGAEVGLILRCLRK